MGALTEVEIFDRMIGSLRGAISACVELATNPVKGPTYAKLRTELKFVEGCCRQASVWREDTRWLDIGLTMSEAHKRAGNWLRGFKSPYYGNVKLADKHSHPLFLKLADNLRGVEVVAVRTRNNRTGRAGMILPIMPSNSSLPHRQNRPVQTLLPPGLAVRSSGLVVPASMAV
jgi:hypothetical protein